MGVYFSYFLEYRDNTNDDWKLVAPLVPKEKYHYPEEANIVQIDYKDFCIANNNCIQGHVRDVFSARGWYGAPFAGRGFPKDMSEELKDFIHEQELNSFEKDKVYVDPDNEWKVVDGVLTKVPRTEPVTFEKDFKDWKYDKTWVTLSELSAFSDKEIQKAEQAIKEHKEKDSFAKIDERLKTIEDVILSGVKTKFIKSEQKEEDDEENLYADEIEMELNEELDDARFFEQWIYGLKLIVDFFNGSWNDYDDIRIIGYLS